MDTLIFNTLLWGYTSLVVGFAVIAFISIGIWGLPLYGFAGYTFIHSILYSLGSLRLL